MLVHAISMCDMIRTDIFSISYASHAFARNVLLSVLFTVKRYNIRYKMT